MDRATVKRLSLPKDLYNAIVTQAHAVYPEEACGLVAGRDGRATSLYQASNVAEDRRRYYVVDPQTLLRQIDFAKRGEMLLAIYHSHPLSSPVPSATDAAGAYYPAAVYLIVSLANPTQPAVRGWHLRRMGAWPVQALFPAAEAVRVRGRDNLWARRVATGDGMRYILWRRDRHNILWQQVVTVQEVVVVVGD